MHERVTVYVCSYVSPCYMAVDHDAREASSCIKYMYCSFAYSYVASYLAQLHIVNSFVCINTYFVHITCFLYIGPVKKSYVKDDYKHTL